MLHAKRGKGSFHVAMEMKETAKETVDETAEETVDDLQCGGLVVIQKRGLYRFGADAVLLANFARAKRGASVVELCSGSGVVSILMSAKTNAAVFHGFDIQDAFVDMSNRSAALNGLCGRVAFFRADIRDFGSLPPRASADVVVTNPPYLPVGVGATGRSSELAIARHEVCCKLDDVLAAVARLLKPGGAMYMVHRAGRLADVLCGMRARGIEPRTAQLAHATRSSPAALALVSGWIHPNAGRHLQGGSITGESPAARAEMKVLPPLWMNE